MFSSNGDENISEMKILTISESPYLLTRNGRINRDVIYSLSQQHYVESLVYSHDPTYFLPSETGAHYLTRGEDRISRLHPFFGEKGAMPKFSLDIMKLVQPNVVVTIGSYAETTDIWAVKAMYPHLFKWVAVLTEGGTVINEHYKEAVGYADFIVTTSQSARQAVKSLVPVPCEYLPYGPDTEVFKPLDDAIPEEFGFITSGKNKQTSNLGCLIRAIAKTPGSEAYIHTNVDDIGDYDFRLLLRRYGCEDRIGIPTQKFISVREGVADSFLNELYNRYHAVVDCSMQSATALTMLEAMATGCVPIGVDFGAVGEVVRRMPSEYQFLVPHNIFVGPREEEYAIASENDLAAVLEKVQKGYQASREWFAEGRKHALRVASFFSKDVFVKRLNTIVEGAIACEHAIVVDSL
jgi:glycosyltransferase involved in cell wall biosynthesis